MDVDNYIENIFKITKRKKYDKVHSNQTSEEKSALERKCSKEFLDYSIETYRVVTVHKELMVVYRERVIRELNLLKEKNVEEHKVLIKKDMYMANLLKHAYR